MMPAAAPAGPVKRDEERKAASPERQEDAEKSEPATDEAREQQGGRSDSPPRPAADRQDQQDTAGGSITGLPSSSAAQSSQDNAAKDRRTEGMWKLSETWHEKVDAKKQKTTEETDSPTMEIGGLETVNEVEDNEEWHMDLADWDEIDEETAHNIEGIKCGKIDELRSMEKWDIYDLVPTSQTIGKRFIPAKWVVQRRGDEWRCRWVACDRRDLSPGATDGFFTPGSHPTTERCIDAIAVKYGFPTRIADADHAYWQVVETDEVYTSAPWELIEEIAEAGGNTDIRLRMKKKLYGERDASPEFNDFVAGILVGLEFEQCEDQPAFFRHVPRHYAIELH